MRVLYVCADAGIPLDGTKGASVHVRQTLAALAESGVEVSVLAARPGAPGMLSCRVLPAGLPAAKLRMAPKGQLSSDAAALLQALDLESRVPLSPADVDLIYERFSLWSLTGALLAERFAVPWVLEVNSPLVEEASRYRRIALAGIAAEIERFAIASADRVLCVSSVLCDRAARLRGNGEGVHLFPNSVDTDRFGGDGASARRKTAAGTETVVIFTGSFKPWHGVQDLLEAFAVSLVGENRSRLMLVGDGPERARLEQRAAQLNIASKVTFTGAVGHDEVPGLLSGADIAVAPYAPAGDFYFSPMKVGEYLASGLPVVATDCGDLDPVLRDGEAALRVPPGDVPALAKALRRLADDAELRHRLGRAGRRVAVERLSQRAATGELLRILEEARQAGPGRRQRAAP